MSSNSLSLSNASGVPSSHIASGFLSQPQIEFFIHNALWVLGLLILIILYFLVEFKNRNYGVPEVMPQSATLLANREKAKWIDVRSKAAFDKNHIAEAIHFETDKFAEASVGLKKFQKNPLIIVCERGLSAKPIAAKLKKLGYKVNVLEGGMTAWRKADMPTVSSNCNSSS